MINKLILEAAIKIEAKTMEEEVKRTCTGEVIYVPVIIEEYNDKIGRLTQSNVMKTYNRLTRSK